MSTATKQRALSMKTVLAPTKSKSSPPRAGPSIAEMFSCNPLKVEAEGSSSLDTISGTTAEKAGALNANPVPMRNTEPRMTFGVRRCNQPRIASPPAHTASQMYAANNIVLRSVMSARAPAGRINRKNGSVAAVDIRERSNVEPLVLFIIQVAAVSCAETQIPEATVANQSLLKAGFCSATQLEVLASDILIRCI